VTGLVPEPSEPVDTASELRLVIEPGDLLCFSGAHVHAGVPNSAGVVRFSGGRWHTSDGGSGEGMKTSNRRWKQQTKADRVEIQRPV
jgi:hypothetical protein